MHIIYINQSQIKHKICILISLRIKTEKLASLTWYPA